MSRKAFYMDLNLNNFFIVNINEIGNFDCQIKYIGWSWGCIIRKQLITPWIKIWIVLGKFKIFCIALAKKTVQSCKRIELGM